MKIHEYQGKEILRKFGVMVPDGKPVFSVEEAVDVARLMQRDAWVLKAQIHAGGRGKGGGVKIARSLEEVRKYANQILGMQLVTYQTGDSGQKVRGLLIEASIDIEKEFYVAFVLDRNSQRVNMIVSNEGGMEIEEIAKYSPSTIHKQAIDPEIGLTLDLAAYAVRQLDIPEKSFNCACDTLMNLYKVFWDMDASLVEINPLVRTRKGDLIALDAKLTFDNNAMFRQPTIAAYRDVREEDPIEVEASQYDLSYIALQGNIGCLVNGAGLAMATMDTIKLFGGEPANFLDVGGSATVEKVTEAFKLMLKNSKLKAILVNIFGGIMRCDIVAAGIVAATKTLKLKIPLVVRMQGTNEEIGRAILDAVDFPIIFADSMDSAARLVVKVASN